MLGVRHIFVTCGAGKRLGGAPTWTERVQETERVEETAPGVVTSAFPVRASRHHARVFEGVAKSQFPRKAVFFKR
jgi:hypothetical protein